MIEDRLQRRVCCEDCGEPVAIDWFDTEAEAEQYANDHGWEQRGAEHLCPGCAHARDHAACLCCEQEFPAEELCEGVCAECEQRSAVEDQISNVSPVGSD